MASAWNRLESEIDAGLNRILDSSYQSNITALSSMPASL